MTVIFKIELDDLIAVQSFLVTKSKFHKRNKLIGAIIAVILLIILNMMIIKANLITIVIGSSVLFFVAYKFLYKKAMIEATKRLAKNNSSIVNSECTLTVSENGLLREFKNSTNKLEWKEIKLVGEDNKRHILYISDVHTIVIKKHPYDLAPVEIQNYNGLIRKYLKQENVEISKV